MPTSCTWDFQNHAAFHLNNYNKVNVDLLNIHTGGSELFCNADRHACTHAEVEKAMQLRRL